MSKLKWWMAGGALLAIVVLALILALSPLVGYRTLGGPVAVIKGGGAVPYRGFLGANLAPNPNGGVLVRHVVSGSSADLSGLRTGDVIRAINGSKVDKPGEQLIDKNPGEVIRLHVEREGETKMMNVTLLSFDELNRLLEKK